MLDFIGYAAKIFAQTKVKEVINEFYSGNGIPKK